ncbi:rexo1 protein [Mucor ambiguus]|uniref:Rexo1 protein n=1 Tax=Mucor ambiguus TaxID=91626 RepID=A0A0C9LT36_9FUNG|nr:rexo1 protein [Mucor ambiguus]
MLPSLGLFKSIPCPLYPNCSRNPCFYSHKTQRSDDGRPSEQIKRQKLAPEPTKKAASPASSSNSSIGKAGPIAIKVSTAAPKSGSVASIIKTNKPASSVVNRPSKPLAQATKATAPISALEARKRTAHTATFKAKPTGPPTVMPTVKSSIPLKVRQLIATKLYEAFARIYTPILAECPTIATVHATNQEEKILSSTSNQAGYKQAAANVLMNLKKRPLSTDASDVGLDGEWMDPKAAAASKTAWIERINECVVDMDMLKELKYPLPELLEDANTASLAAIDAVGTIHECDRCRQDYLIKAVLDKDDMDACIYHPNRIRMMKVDGSKEKVYACCEDPLGSVGCTRGPHVYKDEDTAVLHQKIPYVRAPLPTSTIKKQRLVALDCEMGYTTAGMELIRLTAVDEDMKVLVDELVLPYNMIVDLNSHYSGITTLKGVKFDLDGLRKELFKHIDQDTIIVGHGLENDLNALRIVHTNVIDTVALFPHKSGLPYRNSLRGLTAAHLKKFIQTGTEGHDSLEDASVCIELLELYIKKVLDKRTKK